MNKIQFRKNNGQIDYSNMDLRCKCGHKLAVHAAEYPRPCFNEDTGIEGATGERCDCEKFELSKYQASL